MPHTFGCPHKFGCPLYIWMPPVCSDGHQLLGYCMFRWPPYVWTPPTDVGMSPVCLDIPIYLDAPLYVWTMFGCPLYIYNTKKSMLCQSKGVSICPIHFDAPICLDALCILGCPNMFGCTHCMFKWPPYVWMPLVWLMPPICFGCPCMFDAPNMFGCPLYIWTPHMCRCPLYAWMPHMFGCPLTFGFSPVCLDPPICLDTPLCLDAHMFW